MIKTFNVDNFKSLNNLSINLQPMTVIVGNNATGKSSILQAIDFVCGCVNDDFSVLLERRGWTVDNIRSKFIRSGTARISFGVEVVLEEPVNTTIKWGMVLQPNVAKNQLHLVSEEIVDLDTKETLVQYKASAGGWIKGDKEELSIMPNFVITSSCLKVIQHLHGVDSRLNRLVDFFDNSESFEMLAPDNMRLSSRGVVKNIGETGKNLPSFIRQMSAEQKNNFMSKLKRILGDRISDVSASVKGKPGWTLINVKEHYDTGDVEFSSKEISDGILRVLAFIAISEIEPANAIFLLDEVENGINSDYAEAMIDVLSEIYEESRHQLVLTTHSTVFLDYVKPEQIVLLYRDQNGSTRADNLFDSKEIRDKLEYMYPGEILLNMSQKEIADIFLKQN
nr:AAA family ATPase [uncultured Agathobacter sp.]